MSVLTLRAGDFLFEENECSAVRGGWTHACPRPPAINAWAATTQVDFVGTTYLARRAVLSAVSWNADLEVWRTLPGVVARVRALV